MSRDVIVKPTSPVSHAARQTFGGGVWNAVFVVGVAALTYYALFQLPFWFPPRLRLWSASYAFGFNNGVAILAMAGLLTAVALLYVVQRHRACEPQIEFPLDRTIAGRRSLAVALVLAAVLYGGLTFAMYVYNGRSASWLTWETRHFLHRTWLMDVYGLRPYTDFSAEYGPMLTYPPLLMYRLLKPLGASHEQAYFACHLLLNLGGLWCLYYLLSRATMPAGPRVVAFGVLAIAGFAPYMGLNGVLLRYLCPFACLLLGHRAVVWALSRPGCALCWLGTAATILLLLVVNILLSSEAAVAFALAWFGYSILMARRAGRVLAVSLIAFIAAGLLCWLLLPAAYYGSLLQFSQGANNLPLLPAAHLLFYIVTMFLVVPPLLAAAVRQPATGGVLGGAICGALGVLCLVMAPGALGRCDPPHVLFFGMGASMLLMVRLANISRRAFAVYTIAYAGVFIVLMQVVNLIVFYGVSPRALLSRHAIGHVVERLRSATGTERPDMATLSALDRYPRLGLPFATFGDPAVETYVLSRGKLEPEYYISIVGVYTTAALERKLQDVRKAEYLLAPRGFESSLSRDQCDEYLKNLRRWFLYPAKLPCRADPLDPGKAVNRVIADHYVPIERVGSWWVFRRVSDASTTAPVSTAGTPNDPGRAPSDPCALNGHARAVCDSRGCRRGQRNLIRTCRPSRNRSRAIATP
jgi:hypothetical protein